MNSGPWPESKGAGTDSSHTPLDFARDERGGWASCTTGRGALVATLGRLAVGLALQPGHMLPQPRADLLDRLVKIGGEQGVVILLAALILGDPVEREAPGPDVAKHLAHPLAGL